MAHTILIIDDERSVRKTISAFLEQEGYNVTTAEGIEAARTLIPGADLVISDIRMRDGNGIKFIEELKEQGFEKPVLLMSGASNFAESERAIQLTEHPVIPKPVVFAGLLKLVKKVLRE